MTKNLGVELGQYGIRVNALSPSTFDTPMFKKELGLNDEQAVKRFVTDYANLKGVFSTAEDVAAAGVCI